MAGVTRYCPERPLPPYTYVPGVNPHPTSEERGHSYGHGEPAVQALAEDSYRANAAYLYAIDLFNHGYYWEAHEAWESLWHAAGRAGPTADFLKGLIKLAAAGVKLKEGRMEGVRRHVARAVELLTAASSATGQATMFGVEVQRLVDKAQLTIQSANESRERHQPSADRALDLRIVVRER